METLFWIVTPLTYIFWSVAVAISAAEDTLQYHYKDSVFNLLPDGWLRWYFQDPDVTWKRKYKTTDSVLLTMERRKFLGIRIPAFFFDGWHGFKAVRNLFTWCTFIACTISGTTWVHYEMYTSDDVILYSWTIIAISFISFVIISPTQ